MATMEAFEGIVESIERKANGRYMVTLLVRKSAPRGSPMEHRPQQYRMEVDIAETTMSPEGELGECFDVHHKFEYAAGLNPRLRRQWCVAAIADQIAFSLFQSDLLRDWSMALEIDGEEGEPVIQCSICQAALPDPQFARNYPNLVCRRCDARAVNASGERPRHNSMADDGDNPVFIDGVKCWRRYRYGGYVTMRDDLDCRDIGEFYNRHDAIF